MKLDWYKIIDIALQGITYACIAVIVCQVTGFTFLTLLLIPQLVEQGSVMVTRFDAMIADAAFGILLGFGIRHSVKTAFNNSSSQFSKNPTKET